MSGVQWQVDPDAAAQALERMRAANSILIPTHQNIDADGLGTPLAMCEALEQFGLRASIVISDGQLPGSLRFLPGVERVLVYGVDPLPEYDLLLLLDCSDLRRLGNFGTDDPTRLDGSTPIVNIDHHITNDHFGVVNIVVPEAASTAEIAVDVLKIWGTELTRPIAENLLAGIYGDTLGLRTEATTSRTMRTAAELFDAGANPTRIVDHLFRLKPQSTVCLWEHALREVQWTGQLIWTEVTPEMLVTCGAQPSEAEGLVNFLAGTDGSRAAAILYATPEGWRISMRSIPVDVDVAAITAVFGGGGHPRAAGATIRGSIAERDAFLHGVAELLRPGAVVSRPA